MKQTNFGEELDLSYCRATTIKRFWNYFIDSTVIYFLMRVTLGLLNDVLQNVNIDTRSFKTRLFALLIYALIMVLVEGLSKGKSLGKIITGTRAVKLNGSDLDFRTSFIRNIIRAIPLIWISAFGRPCAPWHDRWSDTYVIDEKVLKLQQQKRAFFTDLKNQEVTNASSE